VFDLVARPPVPLRSRLFDERNLQGKANNIAICIHLIASIVDVPLRQFQALLDELHFPFVRDVLGDSSVSHRSEADDMVNLSEILRLLVISDLHTLAIGDVLAALFVAYNQRFLT
jgi:hypothetical protein